MTSIAQDLLTINAVSLRPNEPFTWASGIKSPIYCDNRITMGYPIIRKKIAQEFANLLLNIYKEGGVDVIAGTATAGIPHAAFLADVLDLPMVYVRGSSKDHGKQNQIEGCSVAGKKVVVVEDLISTGGSVLQAVEALKKAGATVLCVVAIFTYELPQSLHNFAAAGVALYTLTTYSKLIEEATKTYISAEEFTILKEWHNELCHQSELKIK